MSGVGNLRIEMQEHPTYRDGYYAADRGEPRHCFVLQGRDKDAWLLGYDDAVNERQQDGCPEA